MNSVIPEEFWSRFGLPPLDQALFDAVSANDPAAVKARLDAGISPDQSRGDADRKTPVIRAIEGGHHECLRLLLEAGADPHLSDGDYRSPLRVALHKQDADSVRILLEHGADPYFHSCSTRPDGKTEYEGSVTDLFVASEGDPAIAQMVEAASHKFKLCHLLREKDANVTADIEAVAKLLDEGCPVNIKDENDRTALMYACNERDRPLVKLLLDHGADPEIAMRDGDTKALHCACWGSPFPADVEIVKMLIEHGANPRHVSKKGYTYMHAAATSGNEDIMKVIAMHGASVTAETSDGKSPVASAIAYGNKAAVPVIEGVVEWHKGYIEDLAQDAIQLSQPVKAAKRLSFAPRPG